MIPSHSNPWRACLLAIAIPMIASLSLAQSKSTPVSSAPLSQESYHTISVRGVNVFYREAGDPGKPHVLLLHGFPTSSHMFRNLIPKLSHDYHVIAPDMPGFGQSDMPARDKFAYTFDNLSVVIEDLTKQLRLDNYAIYVMDYGAPVGYRIATRNPDKVTALIIQNGNAYDEGLRDFWKPIKAYWASPTKANRDALKAFLQIDATRWQYTHGTRNAGAISPDNWVIDQVYLDREGNQDIQLDLFLDYKSNVPLYPTFQKYFRDRQPPALVVWGRNDTIFPADGAYPYLRDLPNAEFHLLNTGHFALEEDGDQIARLIADFLGRNVKP